MFIRKFVVTSLVIRSSMLSVFGLTTTITTATRTITLPPAGLGSTETAEINIVNVATNSSSGTAASCSGTISFLNPAGATIGSAASFTVTAAQLSSANLPFASYGLSAPRGEIRGVITLKTSSSVPCALAYSFETFDTSSGVTHIHVAGQGGGYGGPGPGPGH